MIGVRVGTGDGTTRAWLLPFRGYSGIQMMVGGVDKFEGPDYEILPAAGFNGLDIVLFPAAPAAGVYVDADSWGESSVFQTGEAVTVAVELPDAGTPGICLGVQS